MERGITIVLILLMIVMLSGCDVVRYTAKCATIATRNCN